MSIMTLKKTWKVDLNKIISEQVGKALESPEFKCNEQGLTPKNIETKAFTRARVNIVTSWMHCVYATSDIWTSTERESVSNIAKTALELDTDQMLDFSARFCG